jgi:hypothetical protein
MIQQNGVSSSICFMIFFVFLSCGTEKSASNNSDIHVQLLFQQHTPYCGGAYPTPEQERGEITPIQNQEYAIYRASSDTVKHNAKHKPLLVLRTNEKGEIAMELPVGLYYAVHIDKTLSFDLLYAKYKRESNDYLHSADLTCYQDWYARPEMRFKVSPDAQIVRTSVVIQSACFTGLNPCVAWVGPMPPSVGH